MISKIRRSSNRTSINVPILTPIPELEYCTSIIIKTSYRLGQKQPFSLKTVVNNYHAIFEYFDG